MVVDDVLRIIFFFAARESVNGGPLLSIAAEFEDNLST